MRRIINLRRGHELVLALVAVTVAGCAGARDVSVVASPDLSNDETPELLVGGPDSDCDGVSDIADAKPYQPNDIDEFTLPGHISGPDRCDLNDNGILDSFEADSHVIEAEARLAVLEAEADLAARQAEREAELEAERQERERIAAIDRERCLASVAALNGEIEAATADADSAGWSESATAVYHERVQAVEDQHSETMAGLSVGC